MMALSAQGHHGNDGPVKSLRGPSWSWWPCWVTGRAIMITMALCWEGHHDHDGPVESLRGPSWSWWPCQENFLVEQVKCKKGGKFKHRMLLTHHKSQNNWSSCIIMWLLHPIPRAHGFDATPSGTRYIPRAYGPWAVPGALGGGIKPMIPRAGV